MGLESIRERNKNGKLDRLLKAAGRTSLGKNRNNDDQEDTYYPERDKNGNGSCILRFLPGLETEDYPYYVERFQHGFTYNNQWYIEFCPSTSNIDKECPVCNHNFDMIGEYGRWDDCPENIQAIIRKRGRNAGFRAGNYCNVLVIKDPTNPENEGKVHLFKFGKSIMDMIHSMAQPIDNGLGEVPEPVDVFDLEEGSNFEFIIRKKDNRADYSNSKFQKSSKCPEFDENEQQSLYPLVDKKLFKEYDELAKKFNKVMNKLDNNSKSDRKSNKDGQEVVDEEYEKRLKEINKEKDPEKKEENKKEKKKVSKNDDVDDDANDDVDDDNMAYFQGIADEVDL